MDFALDASFALRWCFEDQATAACELVLTQLQNQTDAAFVPGIWPYELLNGLGKGVARAWLERHNALQLWKEIRALPIHVVDVMVNEKLLELALQHNLAIYDASYLSVAITRGMSIAPETGNFRQPHRARGLESSSRNPCITRAVTRNHLK